MAKSINNVLTRGLSGRVGSIVFRNYKNMTVMACLPRKSNKKLTQAQLDTQHRFKMASIWAVQLLKDPIELAKYKALGVKKGKSAYNVAMAEFLQAAK